MSEFRPPTIIVNFKVYAEVEGTRSLTLAKTCQKVSKESGVEIAVCPPVIGLALVAHTLDIPVYSQNVDPLKPGSGTGYVTPSMLHSTDVRGTLVNHSEHRQPAEQVKTCIDMCKYLSLDVCACAESVDKAKELAAFGPQMIAVEPPELIGGDISVTTANPRIVSDTVDAVHSVDKDVAVKVHAKTDSRALGKPTGHAVQRIDAETAKRIPIRQRKGIDHHPEVGDPPSPLSAQRHLVIIDGIAANERLRVCLGLR